MSGSRITMQQARLYMSSRREGQTQSQASAKAGISERSARRIEAGGISALERKERHWRTRKDPFVEVWGREIVPLLEKQPALDATTLFEDLQDRHPGRFTNGKKRTFQRRVKAWKALHGPDKAVIFRQVQEPGRQGLSDFTELKNMTISIAGEPLEHRLYHFRLAYSGWSHVTVVLGGESFSALAEGLQAALWRLGGAPLEHRTDSLSGRFQEPQPGRPAGPDRALRSPVSALPDGPHAQQPRDQPRERCRRIAPRAPQAAHRPSPVIARIGRLRLP